ITRGEVEEPIRPELELAAVVILRAGVGDGDDPPPRRPVCGLWIGRRDVELVHLDRLAVVGEVDVEAARPLVIGRKSDRQQTLLAAGVRIAGSEDDAADVEERLRELLAVPKQHHPPLLLDDEDELRLPGAWVT